MACILFTTSKQPLRYETRKVQRSKVSKGNTALPSRNRKIHCFESKKAGPWARFFASGDADNTGYLQFVMQRTARTSGRSSITKPSRLGIFTRARLVWSITASEGMMPFRLRRYAESA